MRLQKSVGLVVVKGETLGVALADLEEEVVGWIDRSVVDLVRGIEDNDWMNGMIVFPSITIDAYYSFYGDSNFPFQHLK